MVTWVKDARLAHPRARKLAEDLESAFAERSTTSLVRGKREIDKKTHDLKSQRKDRSVRAIEG